jgi:hypothetical protein
VVAERLGGEDPADAKPEVDGAAVVAQLDAAIDEVERKLREHGEGAGAVPGEAVATDVATPVRLTGQAEPAAAPVVEEEKSYDRGEFYPVSRGKGGKG